MGVKDQYEYDEWPNLTNFFRRVNTQVTVTLEMTVTFRSRTVRCQNGLYSAWPWVAALQRAERPVRR